MTKQALDFHNFMQAQAIEIKKYIAKKSIKSEYDNCLALEWIKKYAKNFKIKWSNQND